MAMAAMNPDVGDEISEIIRVCGKSGQNPITALKIKLFLNENYAPQNPDCDKWPERYISRHLRGLAAFACAIRDSKLFTSAEPRKAISAGIRNRRS